MSLSAQIPTVFSRFTYLDALVFSAVMFLSLYAVILSGKKSRVLEQANRDVSHNKAALFEQMLMARRLTLPLFVLSLFASWYGGIFGVTEIAFKHGVFNFVTQGVFWYATYLFFAFVIVKRLPEKSFLSFPEMIVYYYGKPAGKIAGVFNFFNLLPIAYVISVGLFLQVLTGFSLPACMVFGVILVCAYNAWGGFRADVYTDAVQAVVMLFAVLFVVGFSIYGLGGYEFLAGKIPAEHWTWHGGHSLSQTLVWGFIALSTLVDPVFYQRCFASAKRSDAKKGILIATAGWILFDLCTTTGALYARAYLPDADPSLAYFYFGLEILPSGFRGFFVAGILCTILSTMDSFLFIAGQTISFDLGPDRWRRSPWALRIMIFVVGLISILLAMHFDGSIKKVWKTLGSIWAAALVVPTLTAMFSRRGKTHLPSIMFMFPALLGAIGVIAWKNIELSGFWTDVDELYIGLILGSVSIFVLKLFFISPQDLTATSDAKHE